jgi:hypothetical protein
MQGGFFNKGIGLAKEISYIDYIKRNKWKIINKKSLNCKRK